MKIVEEKYQTLNSVEDELILSDAELEDAMRKMYFAIAEDPVGYENYIYKKQIEWKDNIKKDNINIAKPKFGMVIGEIQKLIEKKYSNKFLRLIRIPFFLRVKVIDISKKNYTIKGEGHRNQTELIGKVEEVIKGENHFKNGEIVSFMYRNHLTDNIRVNDFIIGSSYFIPLSIASPQTFKETGFKGLVVQFLDENISYLIKNQILKTIGNYLKISEDVGWSNFKKQFLEKYTIQDKEAKQ